MSPSDDFANELRIGLNSDQRNVFDECIDGTSSVFCTGQGGTGKSKLLSLIVEYFRAFPLEDGSYVSVTASTGIASFLVKGMTLHRFAGVGIEEQDTDMMYSRASKGVSLDYWTRTGILIIDEVSMVSPTFFNNISVVASRIRSNDAAFGGIRLLMFGDFLQLPPISSGNDGSIRAFHTDAWKGLSPKIMQLKAVVRQTSVDYVNILSQIRHGVCNQNISNYMNCLDYEPEYDDGIDAVRLFARRKDADAYNTQMLDTLDSPCITFKSFDRGTVTLLKQCPAPELLQLKIGCQIILTRNLNDRAANGSVGTVISFEEARMPPFKKPVVRLLDQNNEIFDMVIQLSSWETLTPSGTVAATRIQLPLLLAWAITIHRSQGQTITRLCVDMSGIFETGQAYVALSRCPDPSNLSVRNFRPNHVIAAPSCIRFYQELDSQGPAEDLPSYDAPPEYSEESNIATSVASTTESQWDSTQVQYPRIALTEDATLDTGLMMGNLSMQSDSRSQTPIDYRQEFESS